MIKYCKCGNELKDSRNSTGMCWNCYVIYRKGSNHPMFGKKHTTKTKEKISKGNKGKKRTEEFKNNIRNKRLGKKHNKLSIEKMIQTKLGKNNPNYHKYGSLNPNWKGTTSIRLLIYNSNKMNNWKNNVFIRDNYTCQDCGHKSKGDIEAHHIKPFALILKEFLKKYVIYKNNKQKLIQLARKHAPFWKLNNGKTLCEKCHKQLKIETFRRIKNGC